MGTRVVDQLRCLLQSKNEGPILNSTLDIFYSTTVSKQLATLALSISILHAHSNWLYRLAYCKKHSISLTSTPLQVYVQSSAVHEAVVKEP